MHKIVILLLAAICVTHSLYAQITPEQRIAALGLTLPKLSSQPTGNYSNSVRSGNLMFLSGKGPLGPDGKYITGRAGSDVSLEAAQQAARFCALQQLAVLKKELGSLSRIKRVVKVGGFINSTADFHRQSQVMDAFSQLIVKVLGTKGIHARTAVSTVSLPNNWTVEVDAIIEFQ